MSGAGRVGTHHVHPMSRPYLHACIAALSTVFGQYLRLLKQIENFEQLSGHLAPDTIELPSIGGDFFWSPDLWGLIQKIFAYFPQTFNNLLP